MQKLSTFSELKLAKIEKLQEKFKVFDNMLSDNDREQIFDEWHYKELDLITLQLEELLSNDAKAIFLLRSAKTVINDLVALISKLSNDIHEEVPTAIDLSTKIHNFITV